MVVLFIGRPLIAKGGHMETNQINYQSKNAWKPIGIIFIITTAILLGLAIFLFVQNNQKQSQLNNVSNNEKCEDKNDSGNKDNVDQAETPDVSDNNTSNNAGYLVIEELGIKVKTNYADQLSYEYVNLSGTEKYEAMGNVVYAVGISASRAIIPSENCKRGVGGIVKLSNVSNHSAFTGKILGNYGFIGFAPNDGGICSDAETELKYELFNALTNPQNFVAL